MFTKHSAIRALAFLLCVGHTSYADIIGVLGAPWGPPPALLGPYEMTPFPADPRPIGQYVSTVPSPLGGDIAFSVDVIHRTATALWGHGYFGDAYLVLDTGLEIELPPGTRAFYFYIKADSDVDYFEVVADDLTTLSVTLFYGEGASCFGFYVDSPLNPDLHRISISLSGWIAFYVGEFGIAVPEPGSLALVLPALLLLRRR